MRTFLVLLGFLASVSAQSFERRPGRVTKIVDGDTVHLAFQKSVHGRQNARATSVRLIGVDTAELHLVTDRGTFSQGYWAEEGTRYLQRLLPMNSTVFLEDHGADKYGRTLGRLFFPVEGKNYDINLAIVRSGWGIPYIICGGETCNPDFFESEQVGEYLAACRDARAEGRGIFNPQRPLQEMPFEFRLRVQRRKADKYVGSFSDRKMVPPNRYKEVDVCDRIFFFERRDGENAGFTE